MYLQSRKKEKKMKTKNEKENEIYWILEYWIYNTKLTS